MDKNINNENFSEKEATLKKFGLSMISVFLQACENMTVVAE